LPSLIQLSCLYLIVSLSREWSKHIFPTLLEAKGGGYPNLRVTNPGPFSVSRVNFCCSIGTDIPGRVTSGLSD